MTSNVNTGADKTINGNIGLVGTITDNSNRTIHMNNGTTYSNSNASTDITSSVAALTPMITVVEAATATSSTLSNNNTSSLPATVKNISLNSTMNGATASDGESQNMRLILPVFIQNERKHSQPERQRKIQSSPVKSMRRFSQDSSEFLGKHLNVSRSSKTKWNSFFCGDWTLFRCSWVVKLLRMVNQWYIVWFPMHSMRKMTAKHLATNYRRHYSLCLSCARGHTRYVRVLYHSQHSSVINMHIILFYFIFSFVPIKLCAVPVTSIYYTWQ